MYKLISVKSRRETALRLPLGELDSLHPAQTLVETRDFVDHKWT